MAASSAVPRTVNTEGGKVQAAGGVYIVRKADAQLYEHCRAGRLAYVLHTRQVGKSSLLGSVSAALVGKGVQTALIDLTMLGTVTSAEQWYFGIVDEIAEQLDLSTDVHGWWKENEALGLTHRMRRFFSHLLVREVEGSAVIFFDEIDTTLPLPFTDDFFAMVRELYQARASEPALERLNFVIAGSAAPDDLMKDPERTPFNIGERVELLDFSLEEALPLAEGFNVDAASKKYFMSKVLEWTAGHPYLTQVLCAAIARAEPPVRSLADIDEIVRKKFLSTEGGLERNLRFVSEMLLSRSKTVGRDNVLRLLRQVRRGAKVPDEGQSPTITHLKLAGLIVVAGDQLAIRNNIYRDVFDEQWLENHISFSWRRLLDRTVRQALPSVIAIAIAVGLFVFLSNKLNEEKVTQEKKHAARVREWDEWNKAREEVEEQRRRVLEHNKRLQAEVARLGQSAAKEFGADPNKDPPKACDPWVNLGSARKEHLKKLSSELTALGESGATK